MMINNPIYSPKFLAGKFANPLSLFVTDLVRQKPDTCIIDEAVVFLNKHAKAIGIPDVYRVEEPAKFFEDMYSNRKLYYSYINPDKVIYGLPDVFFSSSPCLAVYHCEHRQLRKHGSTVTNDAMLAEGLLLLLSAIYFGKRTGNMKSLFCFACNNSMLRLMKPYILQPEGRKLEVLEIPDIMKFASVTDYLQTNGFTEMPLAQTDLRATILGKCKVEEDETVLLYLGLSEDIVVSSFRTRM